MRAHANLWLKSELLAPYGASISNLVPVDIFFNLSTSHDACSSNKHNPPTTNDHPKAAALTPETLQTATWQNYTSKHEQSREYIMQVAQKQTNAHDHNDEL